MKIDLRLTAAGRTARRGALAVCLSLVGSAGFAASPPPEKVALTNVRIIPVVGEVIPKGTVLIERGKIAALGASVDVPYDARVFDLAGKTVFPGMIVAHTWFGLDVSNESRPIVAHLDVYDAIDPSQAFFEDCLRNGVTAVHVMQGNDTVIGALSRVVRPIGLTVSEMTIAEGQRLKVSVAPRSGSDRMLQMALLREAFLELDDYLSGVAEQRYEEKLKEEDRKIDVGPAEARQRGRELIRAEDIDDQHRNLLRLRYGGQVQVAGAAGAKLFGPLGAFIYCAAAMDIAPAVKFAKEHGFFDQTVFVIDSDCHKAVDELKAAARPLVLSAELFHRQTDPLTGKITETFVPKKLYDAGLQFAVVPGDASLAEGLLNYQAARLTRHGIPRDEALRAITLNPARILGLEERLGSLEVGKDASVVVFSGDPLDFKSVVELVFIDGIPAYDREKDVRLRRLLTTEEGARDD
jgi:imidazolonepropionase-like amidohydrolase